MPDDQVARDDAARAADHAGIARLADELVPALIAKLSGLNVGELEVREGDWQIRLRRPPGATGPTYGRRATDRASRAHPGHEQHGHAPGAPEPHRAARASRADGAAASTNGSGGGTSGLAAVGPGRTPEAGRDGGRDERQFSRHGDVDPDRVATSPAVGVFQPDAKRAVAGSRVRAGDRLGVVDMLGVPQEVVAPADGIVVGVIVEGGTAVEYGQELVHLQPAPAPAAEVR